MDARAGGDAWAAEGVASLERRAGAGRLVDGEAGVLAYLSGVAAAHCLV